MTDTLHKTSQSRTMNDTPETDEFERSECDGNESSLSFARKLERERNIWKSRADAYQQDYEQMLRRIDGIVTDRDGWKKLAVDQEKELKEAWHEVERWRSLSKGWMEESISAVKEAHRLYIGIKDELKRNAHLADGDDCTLIGLKMMLDERDR